MGVKPVLRSRPGGGSLQSLRLVPQPGRTFRFPGRALEEIRQHAEGGHRVAVLANSTAVQLPGFCSVQQEGPALLQQRTGLRAVPHRVSLPVHAPNSPERQHGSGIFGQGFRQRSLESVPDAGWDSPNALGGRAAVGRGQPGSTGSLQRGAAPCEWHCISPGSGAEQRASCVPVVEVSPALNAEPEKGQPVVQGNTIQRSICKVQPPQCVQSYASRYHLDVLWNIRGCLNVVRRSHEVQPWCIRKRVLAGSQCVREQSPHNCWSEVLHYSRALILCMSKQGPCSLPSLSEGTIQERLKPLCRDEGAHAGPCPHPAQDSCTAAQLPEGLRQQHHISSNVLRVQRCRDCECDSKGCDQSRCEGQHVASFNRQLSRQRREQGKPQECGSCTFPARSNSLGKCTGIYGPSGQPERHKALQQRNDEEGHFVRTRVQATGHC